MNYKQKQNPELISLKPVSNGQRNRVVLHSKEITHRNKNIPHKPLLKKITRAVGINNQGRRTCETKVSGHKKQYRTIDFTRTKINIPGVVHQIEYDPFRTANIALIHYADGEKRYILAAKNMIVGQKVISGISEADCVLSSGNSTLIKNIPYGRAVHNIELQPNSGAKICRAAGSSAIILAHDAATNRTKILLPSKEIRTLSSECRATLGEVGNIFQSHVNVGSAGHNIKKGVKPTVRGSAKNTCDHPHGGGEGKQPIGRIPVNKNGKKVIQNTRIKKKFTNKFIVRKRTK